MGLIILYSMSFLQISSPAVSSLPPHFLPPPPPPPNLSVFWGGEIDIMLCWWPYILIAFVMDGWLWFDWGLDLV